MYKRQVEEQEKPDSQFSTVSSPNPEDLSSFEIAIKKAKELGGEIIIGTDPDCDRVGAIVKMCIRDRYNIALAVESFLRRSLEAIFGIL